MTNFSNCKSVKSEQGVENDDRRSGLNHDVGKKVVNKVVENLKNHVPSSDPNNLNQLNKVAVKFEENIYHNPTTKGDYVIGICKKMMPTEKSCNQSIAAFSSSPGLTQTTMLDDAVGNQNCSSLQDMPRVLHDLVGNLVGQGRQSNVFVNTDGEMPGSQPLQQVVLQPQHQQQLQHQCLKQKVQQTNIHSSSMQPNTQYSHHHQQQQQTLPQASQLQTSLQSMLPTQHHQQLMVQQSHTTVFQQNRQLGLQSSVLQQQQPPMYQQSMSESFEQPFIPRSSVSGMQQQQKMVGLQSEPMKGQPQLHSLHILQQAEVSAAQQEGHQTSQPVQLDQLLSSQKQSTSLQEDMQQRLQTSATLLQTQKVLPKPSSASVESTAQTQPANASAWHDQAYHKLQSMRKSVFPELINVYKMVRAMCLKATQPEEVKKFKSNKIAIERMMKFLQMARGDIVHFPKGKFVNCQQMIIEYLSSIRKKSVSLLHHNQQLQLPGGRSQIPQLPQHRNMNLQFHPVSIPLTRTPAGSSPLLSTQQGVPNLQINMINAIQSGSEMGSKQQNAPSPLMQHGSARSIHQNTASAPQQTNSSHNTDVNASHTSVNLIQSNSTSIPSEDLKQQQKHQIMQPQKLNQQIQQQWIQQTRQKPLHKVYHVNDLMVRQLPSVSSGMLQQQHSTGQRIDPHQSLLPTTHCQPNATSPLMSQHSSPQIDQQNLSSPPSKARTPSQSSSSPFIVASPPSQLTSSSLSVDLDKDPSGVSPFSITENAVHPQTPVSVALVQPEIQIQNQSLVIDTPGLPISPLLTEFTSSDGNQQLPALEKPLDLLLQMVKLMSPKALSASVCDICSVVSMIDRIAGTTAGKESRAAIGEDLSAKTRCRLQARNFNSHHGCSSEKRMKRQISAVTLNPLSSSDDRYKQLSGQISDSESTASSRKKRRSIEPNNAILEEIRYINQRLVETVMDVVLDSTEGAVTTDSLEGTVVRCSYSAVALSVNFKLQCASSQMVSTLPLWLLVPRNYPNSSPIVLDRFPVEWRYDIQSHDSKESEDLSEKAKTRFKRSLRNLSQPMSLKEMARTWDVCARTVFSEYAQLVGGERFSSRYGTWENCVTAS